MKIVATIHDIECAAHVGGPVESVSEIIEVPEKNIPPKLRQAIVERKSEYTPLKTITFSLWGG